MRHIPPAGYRRSDGSRKSRSGRLPRPVRMWPSPSCGRSPGPADQHCRLLPLSRRSHRTSSAESTSSPSFPWFTFCSLAECLRIAVLGRMRVFLTHKMSKKITNFLISWLTSCSHCLLVKVLKPGYMYHTGLCTRIYCTHYARAKL